MAKEKEIKTNAMRILDRQKIKYEVLQYECDEFVDGLHTAEKTGAPVEQSFKTLVAQGKSKQYYVLVLPIAEEVDLKKAAKAVGEKSIEMIHVKDITFLRRIVRGPADDSYGIEVAKLAGLPGTVTRRAHEVLRALEATAPKNKVEQMDFDALQEYSSPAVPSEMMEKLEAVDVETLTPIEAMNELYKLKKMLD